MKKYEVIRVDSEDKAIGLKVGDIVEFKKIKSIHLILVKLQKHLHGKGIRSGYKNKNYWLFLPDQIKEVK